MTIFFNVPTGTPISTTVIQNIFATTNTSTPISTWYGTFPQNAVVGWGTCKLDVDSVISQVRLMTADEFNRFIFQVLAERNWHQGYPHPLADAAARLYHSGFVLPSGTYHLPDGAVLTVEYDQSYKINDRDAKVTYAANRNREFNEYVNVSDILDQFMQYAARLKLTREQFLAIPIQTFLMWLIIEAAKKDGETPPDQEVKQLELALRP